MRPAGSVRAAPPVDIDAPAGPGRLAGVRMAGFTGRTDDVVDLQVVPYPAVTLFVDFGDAVVVEDADGRQQHGSVVAGLAPSAVRGSGYGVDLLQIRLSPIVAHAVLGDPSALGGTVVAFDELWGRDAERIRDRLRATGSWADRFAIAEGALGRRFETGRAVDPEVAFAWTRMMASQGRVRIERLVAEIGWSRKRLWSRFRSQVGLTPKRAAQLIRFDHAAHRLASGDSAALVAAESGYADQSHLCRDTMAFAGATPTALAIAPWLAVDDVAWAGWPSGM